MSVPQIVDVTFRAAANKLIALYLIIDGYAALSTTLQKPEIP